MKGEIQVWGRRTPARIINLTPHDVVVFTASGPITFPPSGRVARCDLERRVIGELEAGGVTIPLSRSALGSINGLPEPEEGTYYIVSLMVASAAPDRDDLLIPDSPLKDSDGRTIGCRSLCLTGDSHLAFVGDRTAGGSSGARDQLPALRVTTAVTPDEEEAIEAELEAEYEEAVEYAAEPASARRRPPVRPRRVMTSFDAWMREVEELLVDRTGRRAESFTCPWRRIYDRGALPEDAVSEVLGLDLFSD